MKRKFSIFGLLIAMLAVLTFGLVACGESDGRVNPRIIVETKQTELALDVYDAMDYKVPFAGVYYENLDRVDGVDIRVSLKDETGGFIYENELDYSNKIKIPTFMGKYELIYTAEGCDDFIITVYVCERLEMGFDFTLTGNTLTWEPVYGAVGYEVTVNGEEPTATAEASFTSDIFSEEGFYVGVIAKGDNKQFIDSYMVSYENRIELVGGEVAAFNNPCYELDIGQATPSGLNAPPSEIEYLTEEECAGSTGGAVKLLIKSGEYGTGLFRVKLQKKIDKNEEFDGMEVRFKLDSKSYVYGVGEDTTRFILGVPTADERRVSRGTYLYAGHNDSWQIVKIPKSAVNDFDGLNYLQFSLYNMTRSGGKGYLYLDYIRLYKDEIATPTELTVNEGVLDWADVENAYEYIVSVDKTDDSNGELQQKLFYTKESQIALSDLGLDVASQTQQYEIKVCAVSADKTLGSSAWSEKVAKRAELTGAELAPMDNAIYAMDVQNPLLNEGKKSFGHLYYKEYTSVMGADGGSAILMALTAQSTYGTFSCFTVNLTKPLNLENEYDCIIVRFKVVETIYNSLETMSIQLVGSEKDNQNYNNGTLFRKPIVVGEWMEYQLTMDDLKTYYQTGDTKLSFQITNTVANKGGVTVYSTVALDWIRYYNSVEIPTNLRVEDKTLLWDEVENAGSYTVEVNGVAYGGITETSYDLTGLTGANTIRVLAESAVSELTSSVYSEPAYYEVLTENQLSTFNHEGYANKVVGGNPNTTNAQTKAQIRSSKFDETVGTDGALGLQIRADVSSWRSAGFSHIVTVNLEKPLDLTNNAGIKVNFLVEWVTNPSATTEMRFMVLHANLIDMDYRAGEAKAGFVTATADSTKTNFQAYTVTSEELKAIGYKDGDTYLTLNIWTNGDTKPGTGGSAYLWLDDISYCKMIAAPTGVALDGNILSWTAVDGAKEYIVSVNGVETTVTTTNFDLASYAGQSVAVAKVCAIHENSAEWGNSVWTAEVTKYFLAEDELATFNHSAYLNNVLPVVGERWDTWRDAAVYNETDGAITLNVRRDDYRGGTSNYTALAAFTVVLPKALDLNAGYSGITIKLYLNWISAVGTVKQTATLEMLDMSKKTTWNNAVGTPSVTIGDGVTDAQGWMELTITNEQLAALGYKTGDTLLTFGIRGQNQTQASAGGSANFNLDYIKYTN